MVFWAGERGSVPTCSLCIWDIACDVFEGGAAELSGRLRELGAVSGEFSSGIKTSGLQVLVRSSTWSAYR